MHQFTISHTKDTCRRHRSPAVRFERADDESGIEAMHSGSLPLLPVRRTAVREEYVLPDSSCYQLLFGCILPHYIFKRHGGGGIC